MELREEAAVLGGGASSLITRVCQEPSVQRGGEQMHQVVLFG